jgi:asparagine synthase (glutamine-hydrolysing)
MQHGQTKVLLRKVMAERLPATILTKPKQGFSMPLKHWLCGPLRPLMADLLSAQSIHNRGCFQPEPIAQWVAEHLAGRANHSHRLWGLMVFELWQRAVLDRPTIMERGL